MSILMDHKDYAADGAGSVSSVSGDSALLNEVLFRLTARRGSFPMMPELGSDLYLLRREKPSARQALAKQYAARALRDLEDVTVTDAWVTAGENGLSIRVELSRQGQVLSVELEE